MLSELIMNMGLRQSHPCVRFRGTEPDDSLREYVCNKMKSLGV